MNCIIRNTLALGAFALFGVANTAHAQTETLSAVFTQPDGGVTINKYVGVVQVEVTGVGQSNANLFNDAFYLYQDGAGAPLTPPYNRADGFNQLAYSPTALLSSSPSSAAVNFMAAGLPAYNANHDYIFLLDTGLSAPGNLHFGVTDLGYGDNTGAYRITITAAPAAVPEPGSVALLAGMVTIGVGIFRKRRK